MNYELGAIFSDIDVRDYQGVCCVSEDNFPEEFELPIVRIKNRGSVGSCVAHALSSVIEYFNFIQYNVKDEMSVGYIYGNRENSTHKGKGMVIRDTLDAVCKYGDTLYVNFPYNVEIPEAIEKFQNVKDDLHNDAYLNRFSSYYRLNNINDIKAALTSNNPVVFAITWYNDMKVVDGILTTEYKEASGGHCMVIYGWNSQGWKIQNSWGKKWGNNGTAILPFDFKIKESWAVTDSITDNLTIKKPFSSKIGKIIAKILNVILNSLK